MQMKNFINYGAFDFEEDFQRRQSEDPTFYVSYVKSRIAEMDKYLNNYIKEQANREIKVPKQQPKPKTVNRVPRSTNHGPRTAAQRQVPKAPPPRNLELTANGLDKRNMEVLRESSRKLQEQLDPKKIAEKKRVKHFLKTAKEYGL